MQAYHRSIDFWTSSVFVIALVLFAPILALLALSFGDSDGLWSHLLDTVLLRYVETTLALMVGVSALTLFFGVTTAWIVAAYRFRFSRILDVIILLPISCPAYLVAYAYTDFFEYAGPVQGLLRDLFGWQSARDYYFPEIRSLGGAIFVLSSVLYPYVYLLSRTAFREIPKSFYDVSSIYRRNVFWTICLPLARPAIAAGLALVGMEVVSDFGTVEFFSLQTLTLGIFNVWIGMNNITAAAQIASFTFIFVILLLLTELYSRSQKRFNDTSSRQRAQQAKVLIGGPAALCILLCLLPVLFGFFIPTSILLWNVLKSLNIIVIEDVLQVFLNTVFIASSGAVLIVLASVLVACTAQMQGGKVLKLAGNISAMGYAFPGTMLAIGVLVCVGQFDRLLAALLSPQGGVYLSGTIGALLFGYLVRFQAVSYGSIVAGLTKISPNLILCSRTLGLNVQSTMRRVTMPLIRNAIIAGGILAFVDIMKELPMTLLLRPFDFETLATYTYQYAHDELMEQAALPALLIVLVGLVPVVFLNKLLRQVS